MNIDAKIFNKILANRIQQHGLHFPARHRLSASQGWVRGQLSKDGGTWTDQFSKPASSGEAQKKYDAWDVGEEKTRPFSQGQAETSWRNCTSYEADQLRFQEASHKDNFSSWQCGQAPSMRGDLGEAPTSLCIQETAGAPGLQPWRRTFQHVGQRNYFRSNCPAWCRWIPGPCWCPVSAHQPWSHHYPVFRRGRDDPRIGSLPPTDPLQATSNICRYSPTVSESERSKGETGYGLEGRRACQGDRESQEPWELGEKWRRLSWRSRALRPLGSGSLQDSPLFYLPL